MPPRKKTLTTFDEWLGKIIDDESETHGGRPAIASWIDVSEQSVNRRARGEVAYLAREVEIIASHIGVPTAELVERALRRYGGTEKLIAEYGPQGTVSDVASTVDAIDNVTYLGHVTPGLKDAADDKDRSPGRD